MKQKVIIATVLLLFCSNAVSQLKGEVIFEAKKPNEQKTKSSQKKGNISKNQMPKTKEKGNLPHRYIVRSSSKLLATNPKTILPDSNIKTVLNNLRVGSIYKIYVPHSVIAFPREKAPVVAKIDSLNGPKCSLLGYSRLEPNSKRTFLDFTHITCGKRTYKFIGQGLTDDGSAGFTGKYHSKETEIFMASFLSSVTSAYFEGLIPTYTDAFGRPHQNKNIDQAWKKGLSGGAESAAQYFSEKLKSAPEFSEILGPFRAKLLVINQPEKVD